MATFEVNPEFANPIGLVPKGSFKQRLLRFAVSVAAPPTTQAQGFTSNLSGQTLNISGARASVRISQAGGEGPSDASISIWGLMQSTMNELQTLGRVLSLVAKNRITVSAGDAAGFAVVFTGDIIEAWGDYNSAPDVPIKIQAVSGGADQTITVTGTSFTGAANVAEIMSAIAQKARWGFLDNGVGQLGIVLRCPSFNGDAVSQYRGCARQAQINAHLLASGAVNGGADPANQPYTLAIWPRNGFRPPPGGGVPLISKDTGMIGYPSVQKQSEIIVRTLFNPAIAFGGQVMVQSSLFANLSIAAQAAGIGPTTLWRVISLDHALDSLLPKGEWSSTIHATIENPQYPTLPSNPP